MLKLICPNCMKSVSVPDDAAGRETPCPECGKPFPVPARYTPVIAPPSPPVLPPPPPEPMPISSPILDRMPAYPAPTAAPEQPLASGLTRSVGVALSPWLVSWIPAVGSTLILVLTFFTWVGVYPGGHMVYGQGAWRAISGNPSRSIQLEELMLKELPRPSVYDRTRSDWELLLPYVLALLAAVVLAWAERLTTTLDRKSLPRWAGWMSGIWPHRVAILLGLATLMAVLLFVQIAHGFGIQRAMNAAVRDKFAPAREAAGNSPGELAKVDFFEEQELAKYGLERTFALDAAVALHILVILAILGRYCLDRRGNKPPPRLVLQY